MRPQKANLSSVRRSTAPQTPGMPFHSRRAPHFLLGVDCMIPPRWWIALVLVPILAIDGLLLAFIDPDGPKRSTEYITLGHLFGALFGQASVAAAWAALGPGRWYARVPLSLAWIVLLVGALAINLGLYIGPDDIILLLFVCLVGQWLLVQIPLWILALMYGLRMVHTSDLRESNDSSHSLSLPQFGIRQLMILTAIVAVVLGLLRSLILSAADKLPQSGDAAAFIFLAVAAIVMTLPLVVAAILPRGWLIATFVVLGVIAVVTYGEFGLSEIAGLRGRGPDQWHFVWINSFTAIWVLLPLCVVRVTGYRLTNLPVAERLSKQPAKGVTPFAPPAGDSKSQSPPAKPP
jgi:hypothetical protein